MPDRPTRRSVLGSAAAMVATGGALSAAPACHSLPPPGTPGSGARASAPPPAAATARQAVPPSPLPPLPAPGGLRIHQGRFFSGDRPIALSGFNYWSALPLSRAAPEGADDRGWDQLRRDLDQLQGAGVNILRILGASEGPNSEPFRIVPALQPTAGVYDLASIAGLTRLVAELERRGLFAILVLNNFWPWSGGMAQYLAWAGDGAIPYPPPQPGGSWSRYQKYTARFYGNESAKLMFQRLLRDLVPRFRSSPAVVWELANEPRGINNTAAFHRWIDETAALIKTLAPGQLVTTGSEGQTPSPWSAGNDLVQDHQSRHIDFITCHLWAQNWGWVAPNAIERTFDRALTLATAYLDDHARGAATVGKPILLEEFGFPRDGGSFSPDAPTTWRDRYFRAIYARVRALMSSPTPFAGIMPWAWSGDTRPPRPGQLWHPGDPIVGDPPHEPQGWYGIYAKDTTVAIVREFAAEAVA